MPDCREPIRAMMPRPELVGDHLVGAAVDQSLQYFAFARTRGIDATRGIGDLFGANRNASAREGCLDRAYQRFLAVWLLQKVDCARFHGADRNLDISLGRHDDDRQIVSDAMQRLHYFNSVCARKPKIQQDASFLGHWLETCRHWLETCRTQ
jgi:hypothetical protein